MIDHKYLINTDIPVHHNGKVRVHERCSFRIEWNSSSLMHLISKSVPGPLTNVIQHLKDIIYEQDMQSLSNAKLNEKMLRQAEEGKKSKKENECIICYNAERNTVCTPCGHMISCETCLRSVSRCPICRQAIRAKIKVFLS